jgi:hypothetical protein
LATIPLVSELNLGLQIAALLLIVVGLRFAIRTHSAHSRGSADGSRSEAVHKNLMTAAVLVSGVGTVVWMVPNFFFGWFYQGGGLGYGSGGYASYFGQNGAYWPQWFLIPIMVIVGTATAVLGVYLVLRMRWSAFPKRLAIQNFRSVMIITWVLWLINVVVGLLVFYYFALPPFNG